MGGVPESHTGWTFITRHARVLATIADDQNVLIRDIVARDEAGRADPSRADAEDARR